MSIQDNNLSAFPVLERGGNGLELTDAGMTLRDYFAAAFLSSSIPERYFSEPNWRVPAAREAYKMADAMLEARKSEKG